MRTFKPILILFLLSQFVSGQNLIDEKKAIKIAVENGLKAGLDEPKCKLLENNIWEVTSLLCDDNDQFDQHVIQINALTGEIVEKKGVGTFHLSYGRQLEQTKIFFSVDLDSLPKINPENKPYRLTELNIGSEGNPAISYDGKLVAFQYGYRKIGIVNIYGGDFQEICEECFGAQWVDNNWLFYFTGSNQIHKLNIHTKEVISVTTKPLSYAGGKISPDFKWIAYTSGEIWQRQEKDSTGRIVLHAFINGQGQELCLTSIDGKKKKYITKTGKYVHTPCWSDSGDSIFFYIEDEKYFATNLYNDTILYSPLDKLKNITLRDYKKVVKGKFPFRINCRIVEVDLKSLEPTALLIGELGRYYDMQFSGDLRYLIYSRKDCVDCEYKLWGIKLE